MVSHAVCSSAKRRQMKSTISSSKKTKEGVANAVTDSSPSGKRQKRDEPSATDTSTILAAPVVSFDAVTAPNALTTDQEAVMAKLLLRELQCNDEELVEQAAKAVYDLVHISGTESNLELMNMNKQNIKHFIHLGGYTVMKILMDKWAGSSKIQHVVILILVTVTCYDDSYTQRPYIGLGLLEQISSAMQSHPEHIGVIRNGLLAQSNMIADNNENASYLAGKLQGIETAVAYMKKHQCHSGVQRSGVHLLWNPNECAQWRQAVINAGGIQALGEAMQRFPNKEDIQKWGRKGLATLIGAKL